MVASFSSETFQVNTVKETIAWLLRLGRPPLPECPIEAAKQGKEPKQPCFFDGKRVVPINWKQWQNTQPIKEIYQEWFKNPKTGIGTLGGWNGKHWLGWIDFDAKDFESPAACLQAIEEWLENHPVLADAPCFSTPSGGYRFLVAFSGEPENFKANNGFSLKPDGSHHVGELLTKNGGHTLLPPTVGINGKPYQWLRWAEYPPIVASPSEIGIYPVNKKQQNAAVSTPKAAIKPESSKELDETIQQIKEAFGQLDAERVFTWSGHEFKASGSKVRGSCPWHESQSGTAFYAEHKNGEWLWRCPACNVGGGIFEYRSLLNGGNGSPKGKEFVSLAQSLSDEVGVEFPESRPQQQSQATAKPTGRNFGGGNGGNGDGGNGNGGGKESELSLRDRVLEILSRQCRKSERQEAFVNLSKTSGVPIREIERLADTLESEISSDDEIAEARKNLEQLLTAQAPGRLNMHDFLWGDGGKLAKAINEVALAMPTAPEFLFSTLVPVAASRIGTSSRIIINIKGRYKQPCIFWTAVVARSGRAKTPAQKQIVDPLVNLEIEAYKRFLDAEQEYEAENDAYKASKGEGEKPVKPIRKRYLTTDITAETLERVHGENKRGLLYYRDELAGLLKARNQYKRGYGPDEENEISQFNGGVLLVDRSSRSICLERSAVSRTGSTQWEVARDLLNQSKDSNGGIARWLFCAVDAPPRFLNLLGDDPETGIDEMLQRFYEQLEQLPERDYLISQGAAALFQNWQHDLVRRELSETRPGFANVYPKIESYTARFALWLHLCNAVLAGKAPSLTIDAQTMEKAITLAKWYLGQAELIYGVNSDEGLTGNLLKLYRYAQGKGKITPRMCKSGILQFRKTPTSEIRQMLAELASMGHGLFSADRFQIVDRVDQLSINRSTAKTFTKQGVEEFVDLLIENQPQNHTIGLTQPNKDEDSTKSLDPLNRINKINNEHQTAISTGVDEDQQLLNRINNEHQTVTSADVDEDRQLLDNRSTESAAVTAQTTPTSPLRTELETPETTLESEEVLFTSPTPEVILDEWGWVGVVVDDAVASGDWQLLATHIEKCDCPELAQAVSAQLKAKNLSGETKAHIKSLVTPDAWAAYLAKLNEPARSVSQGQPQQLTLDFDVQPAPKKPLNPYDLGM